MQKLVQGAGTIKQAASLIKDAGYRSVFFISGQHFSDKYKTTLLEGTHYIKKGVNVDEAEIALAWNEFSKKTYQVILAIGGGSVIDLAKALIVKNEEDKKPIPFFVAAPTTAGSGTEATHFAVVYKNKKKISLIDPVLLPQLVILDPELTYTLTPYQTAVSGMDVLAQAVESYWNKNATGESKMHAIQAILTWKEFFSKAVKLPDEKSREKMQYAAHLAGKAINITRTTGPHALSYFLTANHGIPHGHAVALFLPIFFLFNKNQEELYHLLEVENEMEAAYYVLHSMKDAGLATKLSELNIDKEDIIESLLVEVNEERFANNPMPFDRVQLKQLILEHL